MVAARLKRQKRQAGNALVAWLKQHNIDPTEPCKGVPVLQVLIMKLVELFGKAIAGVSPSGDLVELGTGKVLVHRDDARAFLWGKEVTITEEVEEKAEEAEPPFVESEQPEAVSEEATISEEDDLLTAIKPVKRSAPKKKKSSSSKDKKK
jgi:hypothetical protein